LSDISCLLEQTWATDRLKSGDHTEIWGAVALIVTILVSSEKRKRSKLRMIHVCDYQAKGY